MASHDHKLRFMVTADEAFAHMAGPHIARLVVEAVAARFADEAHADFVKEVIPHITPEMIARLTMEKIGAQLSADVKDVKKSVEERPVVVHQGGDTIVNRYSLF